MKKNLSLSILAVAVFLSACQVVQKHESGVGIKSGSDSVRSRDQGVGVGAGSGVVENQGVGTSDSSGPTGASASGVGTSAATESEAPPSLSQAKLPVSSKSRPRLALILGPGGMRAYAHAGFVQEFAKARIPLSFVVGVEMGALPAALYAHKAQPFDPEWQMMKLKEEDLIKSTLLSRAGAQKVESLAGPLQGIFGQSRIEDSRIPFYCPSYSLSKRQTYLVSRGSYAQNLLYCLGIGPLFEPFQGSGAQPLAISQIAESLKAKGAQLIVYVDLFAENGLEESESGWLWGVIQQGIESQLKSVDRVVKVTGLSGLRDFSRRREMLVKGQEAGKKFVETLQQNYGY